MYLRLKDLIIWPGLRKTMPSGVIWKKIAIVIKYLLNVHPTYKLSHGRTTSTEAQQNSSSEYFHREL